MANLLQKIIKLTAKGFDKKRRIFFPQGVAALLTTDGEDESYKIIFTFDSGWYLEYSKFRNRFEFFYAEFQTDFREKITRSSHVSVNGDVYQIVDGTIIPPQGEEPFWIIPCQSTGERFMP